MTNDENTLHLLLNHLGCSSVQEALDTVPYTLMQKVASALAEQVQQLADSLQLTDCRAEELVRDEQLMHMMAKGLTLKQAYLALYGEQQLLNAANRARPREGAAQTPAGITDMQPDQLSDEQLDQILAAVRRGEKVYF